MSSPADSIIHLPTGDHEMTIVWFHGLGNSAELALTFLKNFVKPNMRLVIPKAPNRPITARDGVVASSWFDLLHLVKDLETLERAEDSQGIEDSLAFGRNLLDQEESLFVNKKPKILLGGFSLGAAMALRLALSEGNRVSGVVCLSGYIISSQVAPKIPFDTPILWLHGKKDSVVPYEFAQLSWQWLENHGLKNNLQLFIEDDKDHTVNERDMTKIAEFLHKE